MAQLFGCQYVLITPLVKQNKHYTSINQLIYAITYIYGRDGPIRKFHYSAEAEYFMNATEAEPVASVEASAEYFLPFLLISE